MNSFQDKLIFQCPKYIIPTLVWDLNNNALYNCDTAS